MTPTDKQETASFDTPLPGKQVPDSTACVLVAKLEKRFRRRDQIRAPANLPLACALTGRKEPDYFTSTKFLERASVLFLVEGAHMLLEAHPEEVRKYLRSREPWEDFDICVFDRTFEWCVGITHNGDVFVAYGDSGARASDSQ